MEDSAATGDSGADGDDDSRVDLPVQLLGHGLHVGSGRGAGGPGISDLEQLPRMARLLFEWKRLGEQFAVWEFAGCGGAPASSESDTDGGDELVGGGGGEDDFATEYCGWSYDGWADWAGGADFAGDLLAQRAVCWTDWFAGMGAGILADVDDSIESAA